MAFLVWLMCCCLCTSVFAQSFPEVTVGLPFSSILANVADVVHPSSTITSACQASRNPGLCRSVLIADARSETANSSELARVAIGLGVNGSSNDRSSVLQMTVAGNLDINATAAVEVCLESLDYAVSRLTSCRDFLMVSPIEDIHSWLSAALQFQYDCYSGLLNVVNPPTNFATIVPQVNSTMELISIALSMTNALASHGSDASLWTAAPEERPLNITSLLKTTSSEWIGLNDGCHSPLDLSTPNVTVAQDGTGIYTSIQQAVDNAPTLSTVAYIIRIKAGVYNERVRVHRNKTMLVFIGDGNNQTVITGSKNALEPGLVTYQTATVVVVGDGFVARGITFQNTAGPEMHQAVAIRVDSDLSAFYDCLFDGYQDTLYVHTGRQFYKDCVIRGTVDFIFGNSAASFQDCQILVKLRSGNPTSVVTAQGRTDPGQATGLVFQNCTVSGTPEYMQALLSEPLAHQAYLGRPWKLFSRTIYLNSFLDSVIQPEGWMPWSGDFALNSLFYGESNSSGPGANGSARVAWSNQLSMDQAASFGVDNFIQGSRWIPCTSVPLS